MVFDLNVPFPIASDSVNLIFASHSLEHVGDLITTMREIYRVSKHGAQICIVAPYALQGLNLANPYHRQVFNEHTPRFWTNSTQTLVDNAEYSHSHAPSWGLAESDYSQTGIDFRCLRMEFFYFPQYRNLPPDEQRAARKKYIDVCDQIVYHLIAVKVPMSEAEMQELAKRIEYYDPPYVAIRRLEERLEAREVELEQARAAPSAREAELEQARATLSTREAELEATRATLSTREAELEQARAALSTREAELEQARATVAVREAELVQIRNQGKSVAAELDSFRHRRIIRWVERFTNRANASDAIAPAFQQLKDDSLIFTKGLAGFLLQPSNNLQRVPFLYYPLNLDRANLRGILLAPILDFPPMGGTLGTEIVSPSNTIVAQATAATNQINITAPTRFDFAPISDSDQGCFWLRVFVRGVDVPVRIFEWRKYSMFGFGRAQTRAFCGFIFE